MRSVKVSPKKRGKGKKDRKLKLLGPPKTKENSTENRAQERSGDFEPFLNNYAGLHGLNSHVII